MKIQIRNVKATKQWGNFLIIENCVNAISKTTTIEGAFEKIKDVINEIGFGYKCGKGGSHIWVSNCKNEKLLLITEDVSTELQVGNQINTIRYTENSEITKKLTIKKCPKRNGDGMQVEFNELKGTFKAYISFDNKWKFVKDNTYYNQI